MEEVRLIDRSCLPGYRRDEQDVSCKVWYLLKVW